MGVTGSFLAHPRKTHDMRPPKEAVADFDEIAIPASELQQLEQAGRCMYCGVAFCQFGAAFPGSKRATGCPLHNLIPEWNDLACKGKWDAAARRLALTSPMPEFTSRVCPALCEKACNLGQHDGAVAIKDTERAISDKAWESGQVVPLPAAASDAPLVTVVGSGPAGLAAAWELARLGLRVRVLERADRPGGLLMYGIPNMKLPKDVVERRVSLMRQSGIEFACDVDASDATVAAQVMDASDAVVLAVGATAARQIRVPGVELSGVELAVPYLTAATKALLDGTKPAITAEGKDVLVIGGGDTGTDCVATALRQGAKSVHQVIRHAPGPEDEDRGETWPLWPVAMTMDYGQSEAAALADGEDPRIWSTDLTALLGEDGAVTHATLAPIAPKGAGAALAEVPGPYDVPAQLVLVAKGFTGPEEGVFASFGVALAQGGGHLPVMDGDAHLAMRAAEGAEDVADGEGGEASAAAAANRVPVYVAGDARTGSSLVVNAIADAIECAQEVAAALL